jgi:hypothetical protein
MTQLTQLTLLDYSALSPVSRIAVQEKTGEIKTLLRKSAQDAIDIGQKLVQVKAHLGHGNFANWLTAEFNWSDRTAQKFINVFEVFGSKPKSSSDLKMSFETLALLAAPSTPEEARETAIALAENGEKVTLAQAKAIVEEAKTDQLDNSTAEEPAEILDAIAEAEKPKRGTIDKEATKFLNNSLQKKKAWEIAHARLNAGENIDETVAQEIIYSLSYLSDEEISAFTKSTEIPKEGFKQNVANWTSQDGHIFPKSAATMESTDPSDELPPWKEERRDAKSSKTDEHPTPASITDHLYLFFWMKIDLDPCSDPGKNIQAKRHFLKEDDGLTKDWCNPDGSPADIFVNPPFSETAKWVEKAIEEKSKGHIANLVFLSKFDSRVRWFESLMEKSDLFLLVKGYTSYEGNDGNPALFSTVLWFFGERKGMFEDTFDNKLGWVCAPAARLSAQKEPDSFLSQEKKRRSKKTTALKA